MKGNHVHHKLPRVPMPAYLSDTRPEQAPEQWHDCQIECVTDLSRNTRSNLPLIMSCCLHCGENWEHRYKVAPECEEKWNPNHVIEHKGRAQHHEIDYHDSISNLEKRRVWETESLSGMFKFSSFQVLFQWRCQFLRWYVVNHLFFYSIIEL